MSDLARADFVARVRRLAWRARLDRLARGVTTGLFWGLVPGAVLALLAGSVALPLPARAGAVAFAAAGVLAGAAAALVGRLDRRALLIRVDRRLGTRELASTAWELAARRAEGPFPDALIEDASRLLAREAPRRLLGRLRLPLLPWTPLLLVGIALALVFPVDLKSLFQGPRARQEAELAMIGEDLQSYGQRLQDAAKAQGLPDSLGLSQELAQLGKDLVDRSIQRDEALDRMQQLERQLAEQYDLRLLGQAEDAAKGKNGSNPGDQGEERSADSNNGTGDQAGNAENNDLKNLGDALDKLREAQRRALQGAPGDGGGTTREPAPGGQGKGGGRSQGNKGNQGPSDGQSPNGATGRGDGSGGQPNSSDGQQPGAPPGSTPAPEKTGPPTRITEGENKPSLRAQSGSAEGESTRLLVRSLPEWTGSKVPEGKMLEQYTKQAESALNRDEVPPKLKAYVKDYFTDIGM